MKNDVLTLAINRITFLSSREKLLVFNSVKDVGELCRLSKSDIEMKIKRRSPRGHYNIKEFISRSEKDLAVFCKKDIKYISILETNYPPLLKEIYNPPFVLFYRGELCDFSKDMIGIIGTRRATGSAVAAAKKISCEFAEYQIPVVSGLALGIDRAAHIGCLNGNASTIAVLGCGIDTVYPVSNRETAIRIIKNGGLILSEYPPGVLPLKYHFPERNRIISGLSRSILIIQAPEKSGALITADFAAEQGRDVYVYKNAITGLPGAGGKALSEEGALLVESADEILSDWGYGVKKRKDKIFEGEAKDLLSNQLRRELSLSPKEKVLESN